TWFRNVRPFSFNVAEVLRQRGAVSILNNVINPENGERTFLHYELSRAGTVSINVFNLAGDLVDVLQRGRQQAGEHSTSWDGTNRQGRIVARGIYFIRLRGPDIDEYRKVMVVK
ncbi:MAG: T9SS C-terminal target domain-containing protein, partial [Spirochaetaceae bacterium]